MCVVLCILLYAVGCPGDVTAVCIIISKRVVCDRFVVTRNCSETPKCATANPANCGEGFCIWNHVSRICVYACVCEGLNTYGCPANDHV